MKIGYARVSTTEQKLDLQLDALQRAGCEEQHIIVDKVSGVKSEREGLNKIKLMLREGDTLVVWKLDRLGRSLKDLIYWSEFLQQKGAHLHSITEGIDTNTIAGKLTFHIFGAIAEFERDVIRERTAAGLKAARARGRKGGRSFSLSERKVEQMVKLYESGEKISEILDTYKISKATMYNYIKRHKAKQQQAAAKNSLPQTTTSHA